MAMLRGLAASALATYVQRKIETMKPGEHFSFRPGWVSYLPPPEKSKPSSRLVKTTPKDDI